MRFYMTLLWLLMANYVISASANEIENRQSRPLWPHRLWPNATVFYKIPKDSFNSSELALVKTCMKRIEEDTCIRFVDKWCWNVGVVTIFKDNKTDVCGWAHLGYNPNGNPKVAIICMTPGVIYHEFLHSLGFDHEDMHSNDTDYCGKYRFPSDQKSGEFVKAVDGANVFDGAITLDRNTVVEKMEPKHVKKLNSLYCCKKRPEAKAFFEKLDKNKF